MRHQRRLDGAGRGGGEANAKDETKAAIRDLLRGCQSTRRKE
jgi:hypothetical protein